MVKMPGFTGQWLFQMVHKLPISNLYRRIDFGGWNKAIFVLLQAFRNNSVMLEDKL